MMRLVTLTFALTLIGCTSNQTKIEQAMQRAEKALEGGRLNEAIQQFTIAVELAPKAPEGYKGRSKAHLNNGNTSAALSDCETALELSPNDPEALAIRGQIFLKKQEVESAFADFNRAIELDPHQVEARIHRAQLFFDRAEYPKVIEDCNWAVKADTDLRSVNVRKRFGPAYLYRGLAYFEMGDHSLAEKDTALAFALDVDTEGRDIPCARRKSKRFTFQDPKGGLKANVRRVAKIDANPISRHVALFNYGDDVRSVAFSPDGLRFAFGGNNGDVHIRSVPDWKEVTKLDSAGYSIVDLKFSRQGTVLAGALIGPDTAVVGKNRPGQTLIRLWDTKTWRPIQDLPGQYTFVNHLSFSPSGEHLAAAYSYYKTSSEVVAEVSTWNINAGEETQRFPANEGYVNSIAYTPEGQLVVGRNTIIHRSGKAVSKGGVAEIWNPVSASKITSFDEPTGAVSALAFLKNGNKLVMGSRGGMVKIVDLKSRSVEFYEATHMSWITALAVSPDGRRIASGGGKTVYLLNLKSKEMETLFGNFSSDSEAPAHRDVVESVAYSPDGHFIASGSRDGTVIIWNALIPEADELPELDRYKAFKYPGIIKRAVFSPGGETIAIGGTARTIVLLSSETGQKIGTIEGHVSEIFDLAFSPNGRRLASAAGGNWDPDKKGELKIWDVETRMLLRDLEGFEGPVTNVDFSPDGKTLASCHWDKTSDLRIWDAESGECLGTLQGHKTIHAAVFSPDGQSLASTDWLHVRVWSLPSREAWQQQVKIPAEVAYPDVCGGNFSPDGKTLALVCQKAGEPTLALVDRETHRTQNKVQGKECAYSPSGRWLATKFIDRVLLYECQKNYRLAYVLRSSTEASFDRFTFSPDETMLLAGCKEGCLIAWDLSGADVVPAIGR